MICDLVQDRLPDDLTLACDAGTLPVHLATWAAIAVAGLMLTWLVIGGRARGARAQAWRRGGATLLIVLAAGFAALAALNPRLIRENDAADALLVVVLDISESVQRSLGRSDEARRILAEPLTELAAREDIAANWRGSLVTFGAVAEETLSDMSLSALATALTQSASVTSQDQSRAAEGHRAARRAIADAGGRGAIWLIGDGHWEPDGLAAELRQVQAAGLPVSILAVGSDAPSLGLISADLGPVQSLGAQATIRLVVSGQGEIAVATAAAADTQGSIHMVGTTGQVTPLRQETSFARRGLQYATLDFTGAEQPAGQHRTLYTLVRGPARVLVYGASPWADGLDPVRFQVARADAAAPLPPEDYDLVVLDSLPPADFPAGYDADLRDAASTGTGLFIVNGPLRGSHEDSQLIADWEATEIGPILPVNSDSETYLAEPPRRDVVIIVDVSGSMQGGRLRIAQSVIGRILDNLRPVDTLTILPFRENVDRRFWMRAASPSTVAAGRALVQSLVASGGTNERVAVAAASGVTSQNCAFFFISDGDFAPPTTPPTCYTQVFWTNEFNPGHRNLNWGAEPIWRRPGQSVGTLTFQYFEPEPRATFFREGRFCPAIYTGSALDLTLPDVEGLALSYLRQDADLAAFHASPPPDPLVAFWHDGRGAGISTGVFLSRIPPSWSSDPVGRDGLHAMLTELLAWTDLDRYDIRLRDRDGRTELSVQTLAGAEAATDYPAAMDAAILLEGGGSHPLFLQPGGAPGQFSTLTELPLAPDAQPALLALREAGRDEQLIPLSLPPARSSGPIPRGEAWHSGIDEGQITQIIAATGGTALPEGAELSAVSDDASRVIPFRGVLIALALTSFAASLWTGAAKP